MNTRGTEITRVRATAHVYSHRHVHPQRKSTRFAGAGWAAASPGKPADAWWGERRTTHDNFEPVRDWRSANRHLLRRGRWPVAAQEGEAHWNNRAAESGPPRNTAKIEGMMGTMGLLVAALMGGIVRAWSPVHHPPACASKFRRSTTTTRRVGWCATTRYRLCHPSCGLLRFG